MKSVRMLAAGAVALFALPALTAPVRACDDRFIKKCEAESEAAFRAETEAATTPPPRRTRHVRTTFEKPAARHMRAPQPHVVTRTRPSVPEPPAALQDRPAALPESPMTRRFRGFIDPQPMTNNSFEDLRRPRLDAEHLTPALALPVNDAVAADEPGVEPETAILTSELVQAPPPAAPLVVAEATPPAPALAQAASSQDDGTPNGFPLHKLVLTLCAALGVAGALRFIVRA